MPLSHSSSNRLPQARSLCPAAIPLAFFCWSQLALAQNAQSIFPAQSAETSADSKSDTTSAENLEPGPICFSFNLEQMVRVGMFDKGKMIVTKWNYVWEKQKVSGTSRTTVARIPKKELEIEVPADEIKAWDLSGRPLSAEQLAVRFAQYPYAIILPANKPPEISHLHQAALHPSLVFVYHIVLENADPPIP